MYVFMIKERSMLNRILCEKNDIAEYVSYLRLKWVKKKGRTQCRKLSEIEVSQKYKFGTFVVALLEYTL